MALTPFEAMCGFRRIEEISALLKKHPEFAACVSAEAKLKVRKGLFGVTHEWLDMSRWG